jgi:predicted small integral membrane protein
MTLSYQTEPLIIQLLRIRVLTYEKHLPNVTAKQKAIIQKELAQIALSLLTMLPIRTIASLFKLAELEMTHTNKKIRKASKKQSKELLLFYYNHSYHLN